MEIDFLKMQCIKSVENLVGKTKFLNVHIQYVMRHSFATHISANGTDIRRIQDYLGHKSVETTKIYLKNTTERLSGPYAQSHKQLKTVGKKVNNIDYSTEKETEPKGTKNHRE